MDLLLISFVIIIAVAMKQIINRVWSKKPNNQLPAPPTLPVIGNLHQLSSLQHRSLSSLSEKHGPLMLIQLGSVPVVVISSLEMATQVLKEHSIAFSARPPSAYQTVYLGGNIISFLPYGEDWRKMRNACNSGMLNIQKVAYFKLAREHEVEMMVQNVSNSMSLRHPVNLTKLLLTFSYNIVSRCITGRDSEREDVKRFGEMLLEFMTKVMPASFFFGDYFPWFGWMDHFSSSTRKLKGFTRESATYFDQVMDECLDRNTKEDDPGYITSLVDHLLRVEKAGHFTRQIIKGMIFELFTATDMLSSIMEWTMSELIKNPNEMKKAQEEVRRVAGTKSKVDEEDIQCMNYLKCIIKETLRLHPPAPLIPRKSSVATTVGGFNVPAKTSVLINVWNIQRDITLWDRPEQFIPQRFVDNHIDFKGQNYEFIPFGSGRRACPGILFGSAFVELVIANLLHRFDWELPPETNAIDMDEDLGISLVRKNPLLLVPLRPSI